MFACLARQGVLVTCQILNAVENTKQISKLALQSYPAAFDSGTNTRKTKWSVGLLRCRMWVHKNVRLSLRSRIVAKAGAYLGFRSMKRLGVHVSTELLSSSVECFTEQKLCRNMFCKLKKFVVFLKIFTCLLLSRHVYPL